MHKHPRIVVAHEIIQNVGRLFETQGRFPDRVRPVVAKTPVFGTFGPITQYYYYYLGRPTKRSNDPLYSGEPGFVREDTS